MLTFPTKKKINTFLIFIVPAHVQNNKSNTFWKLQLHVPHLKWDSLNDSEKQIASSQVLPTIYLQCCVFIIKESPDVYARQRMRDGEKRKRWGNRERVCIACGGHYFRRAPRLGELENIILSGWFDSAMKNVRSGDDKSWCWGEGTGRQGMSFVMSAIWLQPLRLPSSLPSAFSSTSHPFSRTPPPSTPHISTSYYPLRGLPVSLFLSLFIVMIYLNTFYRLIFLQPPFSCALALAVSPQNYLSFPPTYIDSGVVFLTL